MATFTMTYRLSSAGQKAALLAGLDASEKQIINIAKDDPNFARFIGIASMQNGSAEFNMNGYPYSSLYFDAVQTATNLLDCVNARTATEKSKRDEELAKWHAETMLVLTTKKTEAVQDKLSLNRDGNEVTYGCVAQVYNRLVADWPYNCDDAVKKTPEAITWQAEMDAVNAAAKVDAMTVLRVKLADFLADEKAKADAAAIAKAEQDAKKISLGGCETDYGIKIEDGAMVNCPCWESHSRGKNWCATISADPSKPGGLDRDFFAKAKGDSFYLVSETLAPGTPLEFGADYYSGRGRKNSKRWYGFVVVHTPEYLLVRESNTGKAACKEGAKWAKDHPVKTVVDDIAEGIARINSEGAIVYPPSLN